MPAAVSESRSLYGVPAAMPRVVETPAASQSNVSFWNLSGRDVTLNVEARSYFLPQGQSLKLALGRQFTWQLSGEEVQAERVPEAFPGVNIIIRR
jgi:hypothetical protein